MKFKKYYQNKPEYVERRKHLRFSQTKTEYVLWQDLRRSGLGYKFRRQFQIGRYIVDFYCHELRLIIELDGPIHLVQEEYDLHRQRHLESEGFAVLRFKNEDVFLDKEAVLVQVKLECKRLRGLVERRAS